MSRTDLRRTTREWTERAKQRKGSPAPPSASEVEELQSLWNERRAFLSQVISSNVRVIWPENDPDWKSWASIAECFETYHEALVDLDNRLSGPMVEIRLGGV